jgi:acetyl-CoA acetyltransferase
VLRDRAAIAGIAHSAFAKQLPQSEQQLASEVAVAALRDAGIDPSEVDGLCSYTMEQTDAVDLARSIGAGDVTWFGQVGYGGGAGCATVGHAAMAVATGQANVVLAWRARKRGSGGRPWAAGERRVDGYARWSKPWGLLRPVDEVAMLARRYMHEYGVTRDHFANVALACRSHANRNPAAIMFERRLTREEYHEARWISEPLGLYDNCLETDGALAVVVVSAERARDCAQPPAYIHAFAQGMPSQHAVMTNYFCEDPLAGPSWACARRLWSDAELTPADIDVAQIYDAFTPLIPLSLEGYGFCARGEGGDFTEGGNIEWPDGGLPINTSGGGLSEAYVHGFNLILEGVRQIRGTSTCQVDGARACLVTSGECVPTSALILRR